MIANPESFSAHRSILITGCSSGIGLSAAHIMRGRNWRVFRLRGARRMLTG